MNSVYPSSNIEDLNSCSMSNSGHFSLNAISDPLSRLR
jgi:hypothetical protein